jgi:hypothetical protein
MENFNYSEPVEETEALSVLDKATGIITEPVKVFENIANTPKNSTDWLIPFIFLVVFAALSGLIMLQNPAVREEVKSKAHARMEKAFDKQVSTGRMSKAEAQEQLDKIEKNFDEGFGSITGMILQAFLAIFIGASIFFVVVVYYFLLAKLFLNSPLDFDQVLVAYGMSGYILILNLIVCIILAFVFDRQFDSASLSNILNIQENGIAKFLLSKVDIFTIWALSVFVIGLGKLSKAKSYIGYAAIVFGSWILWSGLYALALKYTFLSAFAN